MAVANVKRPEVVRYGGAIEQRFTYQDAATIVMGDLIRISTSGTVEVAAASSAGAVHGMALEAGTTAGDDIAVLLFAPDTVVSMSVILIKNSPETVLPTESLTVIIKLYISTLERFVEFITTPVESLILK